MMHKSEEFDGFFEKRSSIKEPEIKQNLKISSFTMRTRSGKSSNIEKKNQDSFICHANLEGESSKHLFGVYDGHGKTNNI